MYPLARTFASRTAARTIAASALAAAALLAAGCGHSRPSTGSTVRLAFFPNITHGVALIGVGRGTFQAALGPGRKLETQVFNAGPAEIEALFAGQVDVGYIGPGPAINGYLRSRGQALRIVAGASSGGAALVVRRDAGIATIKDLGGRRVAVPQIAGTQDISLRHALSGVGLTSTDKGGTVAILSQANADTLTLFQKKEIDAAWVPEPWVSRLVKEGNGVILRDERDLWPGRKFATTVVIARTEFLRQHPEAVRALLAAHVEAVDWAASHRQETSQLIGQQVRALTGKALPADVLSGGLARTDFTYDPLRESIVTFASWSRALGYQKEDAGRVSGALDLSLLNEVLQARHRPPIS